MPRKTKHKQMFQDCGGKGCPIGDNAVRTRDVVTPFGFDYTTPNAINPKSTVKPRTRTARKKAGCDIKKISFTARKGAHKGETMSKEVVFDTRAECQDPSKPCAGERAEKGANCPVQLFFRRGQPFLRFCTKKNTPGFIQPVKDAREAQRKAAEACRCWLENGKSFAKCKNVVGSTLGATRRPRRPRSRRRGRRHEAA